MAKCPMCGGTVAPAKSAARLAFGGEVEKPDDEAETPVPQQLAEGGEVEPTPKRPAFVDALRARLRARSPFSRES